MTKTDEELLKAIRDNEFFLPADSGARIVSFDKEHDEVVVEVNVSLGSPKVNDEGEVIEPHYQNVRYALRLKFKFTDLFMMHQGGQAPQRDINYTMQKLEEAQKHECSHATGKHDQECDLVAGLSAELKEAREEVFDLYHQACCVSNPLVAGVTAASACKYDNQCMSTYEYAEAKLIEWGLLKPEQCLRRK